MNTEPQSDNFFDDEDFQDRLVGLLLLDHASLKRCGALLNPDDFKPIRGMKRGRARWLVAERALEHYQKHREPLGLLARADILDYAKRLNLGAQQVADLKAYVQYVTTELKPTAPDALVEKVVLYTGQRLKAVAVQELVELQSAGQLTDELWQEISLRAMAARNGHTTVDYLATAADRIERRKHGEAGSTPWTFIDPLDSLICTIGPQQLGLIIAPYKRGKSLMLLWLAVALRLQRMHVLHVSLEDPQKTVEDRLDAIVTRIPVKRLGEFPEHAARRLERFRNMVHTGIALYDGSGEATSVAMIEQAINQERDHGRPPHALIVDYDQKIEPPRKYRERRDEYDAIYIALQRLASKYNMIVWTAAQTQRDTRGMKILSGDRVAEDINKIRNVTCAISLGKGEWTKDSIYLWVAAHKNDKMEVGVEIVPDLDRQIIYDRDATTREFRRHQHDVGGGN
jgi:hypothetical protein